MLVKEEAPVLVTKVSSPGEKPASVLRYILYKATASGSSACQFSSIVLGSAKVEEKPVISTIDPEIIRSSNWIVPELKSEEPRSKYRFRYCRVRPEYFCSLRVNTYVRQVLSPGTS